MHAPWLVDEAATRAPDPRSPQTREAPRAWRLGPARLLFPGLVIAMGAFAVSAPDWSLAARWGLPATAEDALLTALAVTLFYAVIALLERWRPHRSDWARPQGDLAADSLHLAFTGPGTSALFDATLRGAAVGGGAWLAARFGAPIWPTSWPAPLQLVLAITVAELGHYAFHRLSHERPLVWRLHATHHSAPRLYSGVHRWHHSRDTREGNHNYAAILNLWDHLFGTYYRPADRDFRGAVGIEGASAFPRGYLGQLASPFRWNRIVERSRIA